MLQQRRLGRPFELLWATYAVSTLGSTLAFDALPLIAIMVLHAGPAGVALLKSAGLAVGALVALPLGPWVEFRRKRPVMVAMDLLRCAVLLSIPLAYAAGVLSLAQLLLVAVVVAAAENAFRAASGALIKAIVRPPDLLAANGRLESTLWTATAIGPPLGGLAIGWLGPVITVVADALSYLLSALGLLAMGRADDAPPARPMGARLRPGDLLEGWRQILGHPALRALFFNTVMVNGLILATAPLLAVLMLGRLGFTPWQYGLAFGLPCLGGLLGSRLAVPLARRWGRQRLLLLAGALRAVWSIGLAFVGPGAAGLVLVMLLQFGLVTSVGLFNPLFVSYRLEQFAQDRVARALSAWSIGSNIMVALMTALWGLLAGVIGLRWAIAIAGTLMLATPLLLPRQERLAQPGEATR